MLMSSAFEKPPEKRVSAAFKEEKKLEDAIKRLLDRGIPKDNISIVGRNFQSEARITGFLTKKIAMRRAPIPTVKATKTGNLLRPILT
jgi:hypothetical protein